MFLQCSTESSIARLNRVASILAGYALRIAGIGRWLVSGKYWCGKWDWFDRQTEKGRKPIAFQIFSNNLSKCVLHSATFLVPQRRQIMATSPKPAPIPQKFTFPLDNNFAQGAIELDPNSHPELLAALIDPNAILPAGDLTLVGADLSVAPGRDITVGPAKVGFSADVNASVGIFSTPGSVRDAVLKNADLVSQIADTLAFFGAPGARFLMLRWGYDISGTAAGTLALGPSANLAFSANAGRKGYYAIVQTVAADAKAGASLANLVSSWRLPSQVGNIGDLPVSTTLISEVDGSFGIGAKVTFGYDFNWLRAVDGLGLKGDVGLKLQAGLSASIGFGLSGKYAVVLSRESAAQEIRLRLYKIRVNDWNFGFDASLNATPGAPPLPENFDDLLKAVTGTHWQQVMKLLGRVQDWTDPTKPVFGPFVNLADAEAQKLIQTITGVTDLSAGFIDVKNRIQKLFQLWDGLPKTATQLIWSKLPDPAAISSIVAIANKVSGLTEDSLTDLLRTALANVPFLNTTEGLALEALASKDLFAALQDTAALKDIQKAAGQVGQILDGSALQSLLTKLQDAVNTRLDLKKLETVVDQTTFDSLDTWLKARLENFLEQKLVGAQGVAELKKLEAGLRAILARKDELYAKALAAIKRDYEFSIQATYQKTTTKSALLDVVFDFTAPASQAGDGLKLALKGKFDQLLADPLNGVKINDGVLAFGIHKETHVSISLPYFSTNSMHVNDAVAQLQTVSEDAGGLIFSLSATDLYTVKNDFSSGLTIALSTPPGGQNAVNIHSLNTASYRYDLKMGVPNLSGPGLSVQYAPYADTYLSGEFKSAPPGTFTDWVTQITPPGGKLGNTLLSLSLSLPQSAALAWKNAPASDRDKVYKLMSMALQRQFKQVLHDTFFSDVHHYKNVSTDSDAWAMLAFCSIPPCSDVELINQGADVKFLDENADGKTIYWDYRDRGVNIFSVDLREKVLFHPETQTNLQQKLGVARTRIQEAGDPDRVLSFYTPQSAGQILAAALHGRLLDFIFPVEANLVQQARGAGLQMAAFIKNNFSNPEQARKEMAKFGQKLSEDFNSSLKVFAVGPALLPLGTAIYTAAVGALDPTAATQPAAMFTVQILKAGVSTLTPQDTDILRTERVIHQG